ncbi:MAG: diaminopimelate decarboxylase [Bacteroidales bacterium]|jgi:diaminopimelate decarboxylase|nr:diaminopimelate decarboxylase [Bacteroidales bacterium]
MTKKRFTPPAIKRLQSGMPGKAGIPSQLNPIPDIGGIPVKQLLRDYGSPLFILEENTIRNTYRKAKDAFESRYPAVQFAWSYKTNYLDAVCQIYHQEGSWAEVVSGFEYQKALANGVDGRQIIFNGPDKSPEDLKLAVENHSYIHIDHFDELYSLIKVAESSTNRPRVAIRVNMDTGIFPRWDRFGFNLENGEAMEAVKQIIESGKLDLMGLHTHIGTYIISVNAYRTAAEKMAALALSIERELKHQIRYIDMGGGFASLNTLKGAYHSAADTTPTFDQYAEAITGAITRAGFDPSAMPMLILETGRALIDDAGYLAGTVLAVKRLSDGRKNLVFDFGVNLLFTSFWYDHEIHPVEEQNGFTEDATLFGPLCMNIDQLRDQTRMPLLKQGDQVVVKRVGAYNMTQWMQFITYRPNIILISPEGSAHLIRKAENLESIRSSEETPSHLKK